ncbi:MAG: hypothetical protein ABIQ18_48765 [Umezawaea sp.]
MGNGFERLHVELARYDGPRAGLADVDGVVHYFKHLEFAPGVQDGDFLVWDASPEAVALEREQLAIFVDWRERFDEGLATAGEHPGHGGVDARYDELQGLLEPARVPPDDARRMFGETRIMDEDRYTLAGSGDEIRWSRAHQGTR